MKPDWKDAPEWAEWLAMDEDGLWGWFEKQPEIKADDGMWDLACTYIQADKYYGDDDWTESLEARP